MDDPGPLFIVEVYDEFLWNVRVRGTPCIVAAFASKASAQLFANKCDIAAYGWAKEMARFAWSDTDRIEALSAADIEAAKLERGRNHG